MKLYFQQFRDGSMETVIVLSDKFEVHINGGEASVCIVDKRSGRELKLKDRQEYDLQKLRENGISAEVIQLYGDGGEYS